MSIFGGGFTAPPQAACKLRNAQPGLFQQPPMILGPQQAVTTQVNRLGVVAPAPAPVGRPAPAVAQPIGVVPPPAPVQPSYQTTTAPGPFGPQVYRVMKKGEAPCPICRG